MLTDGVIVLREPGEADVDAIVAAVQDPEIPRWTTIPSPYGPEHARSWLAMPGEERRLILDADGRLLGAIGLMNVEIQPEIGYWLAPDARGRGAATRALVLMRDWAAAEHRVERLILRIHEDNRASQRVAERAGFVDTGERLPNPRGRERDVPDHRLYAWTAA